MPVRSLVELATRAAVRHIKLITHIGYAPYELVRPILLKVETAEQLIEIENNCPHIAEADTELWERLIRRDFARDAEKKRYVPKNPLSWGKVYMKYRRERDEAVALAEQRLNDQYAQLKKERAKNDIPVLKPTQIPAHLRRSTVVGGGGGGGRFGAPRSQANLTWGGGNRTNVAEKGGMMKKVKRQAAEIAKRANISGQLHAPRGQIMRAPRSMLNDKRIQQNPSIKVHQPVLPHPELPASKRGGMEARLMQIKQSGGSSSRGGPAVEVSDDELDDEAPSYRSGAGPEKLSASFLDGDDDDEGEDLFGDGDLGDMPSSSRGGASLSRSVASSSRSAGYTAPTAAATSPPPRSQPSSSALLSRKRKAPVDVFMKKRPR